MEADGLTMIERIADEIARIFPNAVIYTENQASGFKEPAFFIEKIDSTATDEMFDRQNRHYSYQVVYFPDPEQPKTDMELMEDELLANLLELKDFAPLRNKKMIQQEDNTLIYQFEIWGRFYNERKNLNDSMENTK